MALTLKHRNFVSGSVSGCASRGSYIAAAEAFSSCIPAKGCLRFLNWNRRFAVAASCLDKQTRFLPNSASPNESESGGGHFPAKFFDCFRPAICHNQHRRGAESFFL